MFSCSFYCRKEAALILVTNNPDVITAFAYRSPVFVEGGYRDVLTAARDLVHQGHVLLTHPLMGSLKPNETPYRTVALSGEAGALDFESLELIENAIGTFDRFAAVTRPDRGVNTPEKMLADFRMIDMSLIESALKDR